MEQSYFQHELPYKNYKYEGGLVLSYGTFSPTRLLNYCCFMIALYVIIIGQSNMLKQTNKYEWTHTYAHIRTHTHIYTRIHTQGHIPTGTTTHMFVRTIKTRQNEIETSTFTSSKSQ